LGLSFLTVTPISLAQPTNGSFEKLKTGAIYFPANPNYESTNVLAQPFYISALHHIHFTHDECITDLRDDHAITACPQSYSRAFKTSPLAIGMYRV
jgi:elongation factor P hydroxylase